MGEAQSSQFSGRPTLFEKISEDIGSGNEGDMLDMHHEPGLQCDFTRPNEQERDECGI